MHDAKGSTDGVSAGNGMKHTAKELVANAKSLASFPAIVDQITTEIRNPRSSIHTLSDIIMQDTGLAGRLLHLANSSFYGFSAKVTTVSQALNIIGFNQLRDLSMATSVVSMFKGIPPELVNMESFWRHSLGCGIAARILATYRREANIERFFVAGLLHDVGRLIIYQQIPVEAKAILEKRDTSNQLLVEVEQEELGFTHADVGGLLLQQWKLPQPLVEAVGLYHSPGRPTLYAVEVAIVHVADIISNAMELGTSGERYVHPMSEKAWKRLELGADIMEQLPDEVDVQFNSVVKLFMPEEEPQPKSASE